MGVNLNNLNLTLDQFNAAASGKYNIGQLKLSKDGTSVYRTNNHKTWTIFNNTHISSEESLALKTTFCQALANEGLSKDAIANVKKMLGIDGTAIDIMKHGPIKPLTAAEVRQVIDQYAEKINENRRADGTPKLLQTSSELYKGVSEQTLKSRETTRTKVNTKTYESMVSEADNSVNTILDILQYTGQGETETISNIQKGIANEIYGIMKKSGDLPGEGNPIELTSANVSLYEDDQAKIVVKFMLDGGNSFTVNTGLERKEISDQMEKVINEQAGSARETKPAESKVSEPKVKSEKVGNKGTENVKKQQNKLSAKQMQILDDLKDALKRMDPKNKLVFNAMVDEEKKTVISNERKHYEKRIAKEMKKHANDPNPPKVKTFEQLTSSEEFQKLIEAKAKNKVRSDIMDSIVEPLQKELDKVRGLDLKNVKLVNDVRAALSGDTSINHKELVEELKLAFTTKVVNSAEKVMEEMNQEGFVDDIDSNLNIDEWLGNKP